MDETNVRVNSLKAWILAARPKTLTGAAVPVMIGIACAVAMYGWCGIRVVPAVLCMLFALIMQVDANFINDYFDFMKGTDDEQRLGPKRACAQGWITASAMRSGLFVTTLLACIVGLPLVDDNGWTGMRCLLLSVYHIVLVHRTWRFACARILWYCACLHDLLAHGSSYRAYVYSVCRGIDVDSLRTDY